MVLINNSGLFIERNLTKKEIQFYFFEMYKTKILLQKFGPRYWIVNGKKIKHIF